MRPAPLARPGLRQERGNGLLSSAIGLAIVVALIGFAVNVTLGLWTRTTVDSVAYDAARRVATADASDPADAAAIEVAAIADARRLLGDYGSKVQMEFVHGGDPDKVVLHIRAPGVSLLPKLIRGGPIVAEIDRQLVIRREGT